MKLLTSALARPLALALLGLTILAQPLLAQSARQTIALVDGWNSVWLEVQPTYPEGHARAGQPMAPGDVFPPEVLTVITPKPLAGTAEFFAQDPENATPSFNQNDWEQWHKSEGIEDNLMMITGNRPYLIKVEGAQGVTVEGKVRFHRPVWIADRYNLIGFGLEGTPTFKEFFGPSGGKHPVVDRRKDPVADRIYRLDAATGNWGKVSDSDEMKSNEAYWIFSDGPSQYMGPVSVDFNGIRSGRLNFGGPSDAVTVDEGVDAMELDLAEIVFTYVAALSEPSDPPPTPVSPTLELVTNLNSNAGNPNDLELYAVRPTAGSLDYQTVARVDSTPDDDTSSGLQETIAAQQSEILTIGAKRAWSIGLAGRTNLYRLKTGGASFWLPITALNNNLQLPTDLLQTNEAAVAGLWVGEVSISGSTSAVENGAPIRATSSRAPLRIILHSDATGAVRLLSQVTIMQTRSADASVPPTPVLVIDQSKIPFFEGIRERNGKKVGLRIEAVAFDMPRDTRITAQGDDLLDMIVAESTSPVTKWLSGRGRYPDSDDVDEAAIDSYLLFRSIRPPALKETYQLSLPVSGAIGPGKTVQTTPGTLTLDPFHRTNPFRHAFHQRHAKGPKLTRELEVIFDPAQVTPGHLRGTYRETISGLTKSNLINTGTIELRRISSIDTLD